MKPHAAIGYPFQLDKGYALEMVLPVLRKCSQTDHEVLVTPFGREQN